MILENNSRIHIIGGGPSGAFFAIHLIRQAHQAGKKLTVTIIDQKISHKFEQDPWVLKGCNLCAGVISPRLYHEMVKHDIRLPEDVVCQEFSHIWIQGMWKNFPLKVPSGQRFCSVFRGSLPLGRDPSVRGLDNFLLERAVKAGARAMTGTVRDIQYNNNGRPVLCVKKMDGKPVDVESDFVCFCIGINAGAGQKSFDNPLLSAFKRMNPAFIPPGARPALVFELKPGRTYLKKYMNKELYLIVTGVGELDLEHSVLVPKKDFISIALVGKSIDKMRYPQESGPIIHSFLSLPHVQAILPNLTLENTPVACMCFPMMAMGGAHSFYADRIAMIGDISGSRLYRDGLYSAFTGAQTLARTLFRDGVDKSTLARSARRITRRLEVDNRYCRMVFKLIQVALKSGLLSRVVYQTFATEMKFKKRQAWPLGQILWEIGSGAADYRKVFGSLFSLPVLRSFLTGTIKTVRNILTELFFGLKWGKYGRYPTVILKEKRAIMKKAIQGPPGIMLHASPQMERMYAIKIRASAQSIFNELGRFGESTAKFLRLRFVDVRKIYGAPNQEGTVVRYALKMAPIAMDIRLVRAIENQSLLYEPQELFTTNGVLLFDISPTRDGNNRLVIYTAFDFKKGASLPGRFFFGLLRVIFPHYAHDVIWNHAICTIKAQAERSSHTKPGDYE